MNDEQAKARYRVDLGLGSPAERSFLVREIEGEERLSAPFRFEAWVVDEDVAGLDPEALVGAPAAVRVTRAGQDLRVVRGVLTEASVSVTHTGVPELRVVVEPAFALLREKSDARVLVDRTVPDIVTSVLGEGGVAAELRLTATYPERAYCVQLGETDFDFVSRLLSEEGIFYRFSDDGTMVLGDGPTAYDGSHRGRSLPFRPAAGLDRDTAALHELGARAELGPGPVTLRDFNPEKPRLDMDVTAGGAGLGGAEHYDFPGNYGAPSDGARRAALAAEAAAAAAGCVVGAMDDASLAPGATFTLVDGPAGVPDAQHVITGLSHSFVAGEPLRLEMSAIAATGTYRPAPLARPAPMGLLTGFVTGPEGEDIHTDEMGRVKVWFPFDGRSRKDASASAFLPVLQDNTGSSLAIPRVGWEVLVGFLEGDPDRPVVLGRVYNAADPMPEALPANKTVSTLRSQSSPAREKGHNEIRLEDRASREQIFVRAEKDQRVVVAHDRTETVTASETSTIGGDERVSVGARETVKIGQSHALSIGRDDDVTVRGPRIRDVEGDDGSTVGGGSTLRVGSGHTRRIKATDTVNAARIKETIGVLDIEASLKKNTTSTATALGLTVGGALIEITAGNKKESVKGVRKETVGGLVFTKSGAGVTIRTDGARQTLVGGLLRVKGQKVSLKGEKKLRVQAPTAKLKGTKSLTLVVGNTMVVLAEDVIGIHAEGEIVLEARGRSGLAAPEMDTIFVGGKSVVTAGTKHAALSEEDWIRPDGKPPATPYINIARPKDLVASTSRTFLNGYEVWTEDGRIAKSEATPRTPGTGEISGTFQDYAIARATFPNVLVEGQLPIRLGDPTLQNARNCPGEVVTGAEADQALMEWVARTQEAMKRGFRMRVAGSSGGGFADGGYAGEGGAGRGLAGAGAFALARQQAENAGAVLAANRQAATKPCECGALIIYGNGHTFDFGVLAGHLATSLKGKFGDRITTQNIRFKDDLMRYLEGWRGPKIAELYIFTHSVGAGLFLDYGGDSSASSRANLLRTTLDHDGVQWFQYRHPTFEQVRDSEIGALLTDDLVKPAYLAKQAAIRSKLCQCSEPTAKILGCSSGNSGHVYSDRDGRGVERYYYWRALNEQNTPKPSIAQALADYLGITVLGAQATAHIEVEIEEKDPDGKPRKRWVTPEEYEKKKGKPPSGTVPHRLEPDHGIYAPHRPSGTARPGAPSRRSSASGSDTVIFEA